MVYLNDARKLPGLLEADLKQRKVHHWCKSVSSCGASKPPEANTPEANWGALALCRLACMLDVAKGLSGEATHQGVLLQVRRDAVIALPRCLQQLPLLVRQPVLHKLPEVTLPCHPQLQLLPAA
jgi:hypothetical protein